VPGVGERRGGSDKRAVLIATAQAGVREGGRERLGMNADAVFSGWANRWRLSLYRES
jgi:hypothetical protein